MAIKPALNQFNGGEISPQLEGRFDWDKYNYSAKLCKNFIPLIEGSLKRRSGSHFVAETEKLPVIQTKFAITFSNNPAALPNTYISIDGGKEEKLPSYFSPVAYELNSQYGESFQYAIRAEGYNPVIGEVMAVENQTIEVELAFIENSVTLTINPDPEIATVYINGIKTNSLTFDKTKSVTYQVVFNEDVKRNTITINEDTTLNVVMDYLVFNSGSPQSKYVNVPKGYYNVMVIGAGGGAAGGSYKDDHKSTGGGGGSGAGFVGIVPLEGKLWVCVGKGGKGGESQGKQGKAGQTGGMSFIGGDIIAKGGYGGYAREPYGDDGGTGNQGGGGIIEVNVTPKETTLKSNGNGGLRNNSNGGTSVYQGYGSGGMGIRKNYGQNGANGYVYIEYAGRIDNG